MEAIDTLVIGAGQAGLATARALRETGIAPVVLEGGDRPTGSWESYYESLTLFSPARFSSLPGMPFPGDPDRYPHRDEMVDYLAAYADRLDADIRTRHEVTRVDRHDDGSFHVTLSSGGSLAARQVISATGSFRRPHSPNIPGLASFAGVVLHAADYDDPSRLAGRRVIVVGAGNSAVQIAVELARHAHVTLATRAPVRFAPQVILGRDFHVWATRTGIARLRTPRWLSGSSSARVLDTGAYRGSLSAGRPEQRRMFQRLGSDHVVWPDGEIEQCDAIVFATGYRPAVEYLEPLGALDPDGMPRHRRGVSNVPGLAYVGLSGQRSISSAALLGVGRDARYIARHVVGERPGRARALRDRRAGIRTTGMPRATGCTT